MTETPKDKKSDKSPPQDFAPAISKLAKKRTVSLLPALAISFSLILCLSLFFYHYFKNWNLNEFDDLKKAALRPDIIKKEFSFKRDRKEPMGEIKPEPKIDLNRQNKTTVAKPIFQKYKSIPFKSPSETSTIDSTNKENKEKQQEASDAAVVAEKSPIDPHFLITEGTYIPCSLTTKFTSDVTGRIACTIAEDIYSANGSVKLIEKGTRAIGTYQGGSLKHGMGRMFIIWTKLITPDFKYIKLVDSQVVGRLGESGIDGWIDSHFFERFGGAILLSTAKDIFKMTQENKKKEQENTTVNVNTMDETKGAFVAIIEKMLENSINIPPTMYKNQGDIIGILVACRVHTL